MRHSGGTIYYSQITIQRSPLPSRSCIIKLRPDPFVCGTAGILRWKRASPQYKSIRLPPGNDNKWKNKHTWSNENQMSFSRTNKDNGTVRWRYYTVDDGEHIYRPTPITTTGCQQNVVFIRGIRLPQSLSCCLDGHNVMRSVVCCRLPFRASTFWTVVSTWLHKSH